MARAEASHCWLVAVVHRKGSDIELAAGEAKGAGSVGGKIHLVGGLGKAGGDIAVNGGTGSDVVGGNVVMTSGSGSNGNCGNVVISTADSDAAPSSGSILLQTGVSNAGDSGTLSLVMMQSTQGRARGISMRVGSGDVETGGDITVNAGNSSHASGVGGFVVLRGGAGTTV